MNKKKIIYWLLVLGWAGLIFYFSAMPADTSAEQSGNIIDVVVSFLHIPESTAMVMRDLYQFIVRKAAHFSIYLLLGIWVCLLMESYHVKKYPIWAVTTCCAYAVTDEIHQMFVPRRACMAQDVLLDTLGATVGVLLFYGILRLREKRNTSGNKSTNT